MSWISIVLAIVGLSVFEIVSSVDNAIINAEVLRTMSKRAQRWFLVWGIFIAVFVVRGALPWLIIWATIPQLGFLGSLTATFSSQPEVIDAIHRSTPILLTGGGVFLILLFLHWLFLEEKNIGLKHERFFIRHGVWFYTLASGLIAGITWFAIKADPLMAFSAAIGSTAFFITHGFRSYAEEAEIALSKDSKRSDISKILYLEIIDMTFSIDGVLGAFAFTFSIPIILIGNGIGALVVRKMTVSNIEKIKKYLYLKNGAMYSIFVLGAIMLAHAFHAPVPEWLSPIATVIFRTTSAPIPLPMRIIGIEKVKANAPSTPSIENVISIISKYNILLISLRFESFESAISASSAYERKPCVIKNAVEPIAALNAINGSAFMANQVMPAMSPDAKV
jgi:hypothetical protein